MADPDNYQVGYGRPPREHRFKPGRSGNPNGRPRGARGFKSIVEDTLTSTITLTENGKTRRISIAEAAMRRMVQKALNGDQRALERVVLLAQQYVQVTGEQPVLAPEDQAIIAGFLQRQNSGDRS